ncbi:MAG: hypothetical protein UV63_C0014G0015 [Microgenomates group bacterium GW2011_GWC1_43_11]|uniref:Uncharacterized protein n=1 Tax=Candidatus Gottesmanbacteria bacterium GW2011_GWA1_44_24b TaxID=1618437 RepID=A0A0G1IIE6_9BACT|nr:MAG: hypothetical protein UV63_C0014G0015 [Microgenomates group bacterium GW2011_GWC1_43_11]KKT59121.1 MAG: hypothetical protein UW52_C0048G0004 [Candidatus Gottesmanbacteria bacterium GW2011_GWA1_44_24b]HCM81957.1 hypothetical protein [Patescibacteria group bacterium]
MSHTKEFDEFIEKKAQANIQDLIAQGYLKDTPEAIAQALRYALPIQEANELRKQSRNLRPPHEDFPFADCDVVCDTPEIPGGEIKGPHDHCLVIDDDSGTLYFCEAPEARLPDGSLPLCLNCHTSHKNKKGIQKVRDGLLRIKPGA